MRISLPGFHLKLIATSARPISRQTENMWKVVLSMFVVALSSVSSEDLMLECEFLETGLDEYACLLENIVVLDPNQNIVISGDHVTGRTNDDVEVVVVFNSDTPFMIQQVFSTFPNIIELEYGNSGLQSINISMNVQLLYLDLYLNNITRIANGSFLNQGSLLVANLDYNNIQIIDEDAFEEIGSLLTMHLNGNHIQRLTPRTFHAIPNVRTISLTDNNLTSIGEALFSRNVLLTALYLDSNEINEVSPRFADSLRENLNVVDLTGNVCADDIFHFQTEQGWDPMLVALRTCFNNFEGIASPNRMTMKFAGPLSVYDELGNLLVTV